MVSFCVFGSQARKCPDLFSDKDLLVTSGHWEELDAACTRWERRGWNVSAYHLCELQALAEQSSLFIQHLRTEGRVVYDQGGQLQTLLELYKPSLSYIPQRNDAMRQMLGLPVSEANADVSACVADVACVLFRNFAISHLASRQVYEFAYENLVRFIADEFDLTDHMRSALLTLRLAKHAYRNRLPLLIGNCLLPDVSSAILHISNRIDDSRDSAIRLGTHSDRYISMRYREIELVAKHGICWLDALPQDNPLHSEWLAIRKYRSYPIDKPTMN